GYAALNFSRIPPLCCHGSASNCDSQGVPVVKLNIVPARAGILWVKLGVQTFFRQPLALTGLFFMYMVGVTLLSVIPYIGVVVPLPEKIDLRELSMDPTYQARSVLMLALSTPVSLLFWHAPALVHWYGISPAKSLFFSGVAVMRNLGAMTLYGAGWIVLTLAI